MIGKKELPEDARAKYNAYDSEYWTKIYFDELSGRFNVYHKEHQFTPTGGGGEAEKTVGIMFAKAGKQVEFLSENGKGKGVPALLFDGHTWDIKYITAANVETIMAHIKEARKADNAIFYWSSDVEKA